MAATVSRKQYDHRVRQAICRAADPHLLPELQIPPSTARSWIERGARRVVTTDRFDRTRTELAAELALLEPRVERLRRLLRLMVVVLRALGLCGGLARLPAGTQRARVLREIEAARPALGLSRILRLVGISASRLQAWRREEPCEDAPRQRCPRLHPGQLTASEIETMEQMATDPAYRHMPLRSLAMLAMRLGRVFAAPGTWYRLMRRLGWRRPRRRVYPAKPKTGIRATRPDEYWHMDVTVIRLLDGTRVYLHAVIDNFSRRILAWRLAAELAAVNTCELLREAAALVAGAQGGKVQLVTDAGVENLNHQVHHVLQKIGLRHVLAQVHVIWSNSMIERFFSSLRHGWLYLNTLDSFTAVERHVAFFVQQHNAVMPHSAFQGQTPDEMYFGTGDGVPAALAEARARAREERLAENRAASCRSCPLTPM